MHSKISNAFRQQRRVVGTFENPSQKYMTVTVTVTLILNHPPSPLSGGWGALGLQKSPRRESDAVGLH